MWTPARKNPINPQNLMTTSLRALSSSCQRMILPTRYEQATNTTAASDVALTEDRRQRPPVWTPHGFSVEWLRLPEGSTVGSHRHSVNQVVLLCEGEWEITLNRGADARSVRPAEGAVVSVPANTWRDLTNVGSTEARALTEWGAQTEAQTSLCLPACTAFLFDSDGGQGISSSSADLMDLRGLAEMEADLVGGLGTPELHLYAAGADLPQTGGAGGFAVGIQGYTYNGAGPKQFELDINLVANLILVCQTRRRPGGVEVWPSLLP